MPKRAQELTARGVAALKNEGRYAVGGVVGLYLRIEGGSRSWVLRIVIEGSRREFGLGSYPEISLAMARERGWEARRKRHGFQPPQEQSPNPLVPGHTERFFSVYARLPQSIAVGSRTLKETPVKPATFKHCAETYIEIQTPSWKSGKHAKQWQSTLIRYAYPVIGELHVSRVGLEHLVKILTPIWSAKTETATRVRGRIESILDWAKHKGYRSGDNPAAWEGNLQHELASPTKLKKRKQKNHPALPYTRIGVFMADLRTREGVSARALEWGILTSTRFQEIAGARHCEVDVQMRRWTIPAERMKLEREHVVPLSNEALALFAKIPVVEGTDLLFPAPEGGILSDSALGATIDSIHEADIKRGGIGYLDPKQNRIATQHGFRSTFRDWAAEVALCDREISEHALAHKLKDKAEAAYQRGTMLMKRAVLMAQWAQFCNEKELRLPTVFDIGQRRVA